ncbi:peptidoglycan DD-metalloendopeptidase family protein [Nostoc sp. CCY0012]|uniref:peptidoglycan DD-metalloendopeptidase family protein n=1 Tax=Nostoc sp. CCY0012 TaxID=1056123 RepID=UPI0039C5CE77
MKRALKKREKAVLKNTPSGDDAPVEHLNLNVANPKVNRRVGTQAAMIGLAISMGATSLLVTRQSDQAQAAAPVGSQKAASTTPAAPDSEVKFASTKLATSIVSLASVPENPVIVEPTAISQLPGLEAKWQVAAGGMSVPVRTLDNFSTKTAANKTSWQQSPVLQELPTGNKLEETEKELSSDNSITDGQTAYLNAQPETQAQESPVANGEVDAQLKAQQEFALNRLQEKSNRLRKSLAELRSEETQNLSKAEIALAQPQTIENTLPPSVVNTAAEESSTLSNDSTESLISRLKQTPQTIAPQSQAVTIPVPATPQIVASSVTTAYEVKPGDTLAAIASRYNTSVSELVRANNLSNPDQLKISQRLMIPATGANRPSVAQIPVVVNTPSVNSGSTPMVVNYASNNLNPNPPIAASQLPLPVFANNSSVNIPTPVTANNQIQVNTAIAPTVESTSTGTNGIGGDTPVPTVFAEIQQSRQAAEQAANTQDNEGIRSLHADIEKLREKYRTQQSGNAVASAPAVNENVSIPIPVATPNNFAASQPVSSQNSAAISIPVPSPMLPGVGNQPVNSQLRATRANEPVNPEFVRNQRTAQPSNASPTRIATPPTSAVNSDNLGNLRGTTVSPQMRQQLPPLAAVDQYLPRPIDATTPPPSTASTDFMWPAKGVLTSGYGPRWGRMHRGIDIANGVGTPIYAAADGVVETSGWNRGGYGILVDIRHADGSMTRYAHNNRTLVRVGQEVTQGQQIAEMGSTGFSTGPHTHFEIHASGKGAVNPIALLPAERL